MSWKHGSVVLVLLLGSNACSEDESSDAATERQQSSDDESGEQREAGSAAGEGSLNVDASSEQNTTGDATSAENSDGSEDAAPNGSSDQNTSRSDGGAEDAVPIAGDDGSAGGADADDEGPTQQTDTDDGSKDDEDGADAGSPSREDDAGARPTDDAITPGQPESTVPMFVAVGHAGRTTVSCDDGESWVGNRSDEPDIRCWDEDAGDIDCDHRESSGTGIAYGNGWFVTTFGWGAPGSIRRSPNGIDWEVMASGSEQETMTSSGLAYGHGFFLTGARFPMRSDDNAADWQPHTDLPIEAWNVRRIAFVGANGGTFLMFAQDGDLRELAYSTDGDTWQVSATGSQYCSGTGFAYGGGVIIMAGSEGCRSLDGGATWQPLTLAHAAATPTLWTGSEFVYWGINDEYADAMFTSPDGVDWTETPAHSNEGQRMDLGAVARSPDGTFVAVRGAWQQYYEDQRFFRSTDGVDWSAVEPGNYEGSHPIRHIVFGYGAPSAECP